MGLAKDFKILGFLPKEIDIAPIAQALKETFGVEGTKSRLDFQVYLALPNVILCASRSHALEI